jgi:hypothetical protein
MRALPFTFRTVIAAGLLLLQVGAIVYARFVPARYFCWAPYDAQNEYEIEATVGGRPLNPQEIRQRYRKPQEGVDNRSIQHIKDIIQGVELKAPGDNAQVRLRYRVNGGDEQIWQWPPP